MSLKVLMFGWELAPIVYGGLGVVCRSITERLVNSGVKVTYIIPKLPIQISIDNLNLVNASSYRIDETLFRELAVSSTLTPYINSQQYIKFMDNISHTGTVHQTFDVYGQDLFAEVERYAFRAKDIVPQSDFDVIHAHDWMTFKAAVYAKELSGKPLIVHVHATEFDRSAGHPNPQVLDYERIGLENADSIIAVSNYTKEKIIELYDIDPDKIVVIHNAIEKQTKVVDRKPLLTNETKQVLFLGRLTIAKGADYLLKAAAKVIKVFPNVKFLFVGKGEMTEELVDLSIDLGISKNVVFTGWLSHDQVDEAYKVADLFVMPSITEPFGLTALEAMRNGTPVLISKQSGVSEVIQNCLKVDFWDVEDMANKILSVLKYNPLQETLMENGSHDVDQVSWETQTSKIVELYESLKHE